MSSIAPVFSPEQVSQCRDPVVTNYDDWPALTGGDEGEGCLIGCAVGSYGTLSQAAINASGPCVLVLVSHSIMTT